MEATLVPDLLRDGAVTQELGIVERLDPELRVRAPGGSYRARPAASCLVGPELGDRVLVAVAATGDAWVLAVLDRASEGALPLEVEGDVVLHASGSVRVEGDEGVELRSRAKVGLVARLLDVRAIDVRAATERLGVTGGVAHVSLESAKTVIGLVDQTFERLSTRMKRCYRFIEEIDMTRAHEIDTRADKTIHLRSKNAFVHAEQLVKVEGDQIHLG
ncbi:MAG: DUF3540 domain-containing protein [Sandaracinaceae bacterium]|nr:DUF3540 domain-containing protein [Sandaracinaceae bacterium]